MTIKTATFNLLAGALVAGSCVTAFDSTASAFGIVGRDQLVAKQEIVTKKEKAPQGYHIESFRGWQHGYPIAVQGCSPLRVVLPGECVPSMPIKQGI